MPPVKKVKLARCLALGLESTLGGVDQLTKCGGVGCGQVSQDLTVHIDVCGFQALDEAAVSDAGVPSGSVDAKIPKGAEGAFFVFAIAIGVLAPMLDGVLGVAIKLGSAKTEALGGFDHTFASFAGGGCVGDSHGYLNKTGLIGLKKAQWLKGRFSITRA